MPTDAEEHIVELTELRHHLHSIAEVSGEEKETASAVVNYLKSVNPDDIVRELGGHGVAAVFHGKEEGPAVMIRCELDALPIPEENDIDYRSRNPDTGHKCGHDGHMAVLCGVAKVLSAKAVIKGKIILLFQPAEETGEGAARVLDDPEFKEIEPDFVFALHNLPGYKLNQILVRSGTFAAASTGFKASLKGATSHAAHPEQGKSPALAMAQLIEGISSIPQSYTSLSESAKATVVHARLGQRRFGTTPGSAEVMATLRAFDDDLLEKLKERMKKLTQGVAATYDLETEIEWVESFPSTRNEEESVEMLREIADQSEFEIVELEKPFGWSEDFGNFTGSYKGALFGLGAGEEHPVLHAADYDFPDEIIPTGVTMFLGIIDRLNGLQ